MAMSKEHREILRKNRVMLVKNIIVNEELLSALMSTDSNVLTADMKEQIENQGTSMRKVGLLLDILVKRGKDAFEEFIKALVDTSQEELAKKLDANMTVRHLEEGGNCKDGIPPMHVDGDAYPRMEDDKPLSDKVEDIQKNRAILAKVSCVSNSAIKVYMDELKIDAVYRVKRRGRGRAVIISNQYFTEERLEMRSGNERDVENLTQLFTQLGFEVHLVQDKTDTELYQNLEKESLLAAHESADMFIMCILSHGVDGHVYAMNGVQISIEKVVSNFEPKSCPALKDKPKAFFVQACQNVLVPKPQVEKKPVQPVEATDDVDGRVNHSKPELEVFDSSVVSSMRPENLEQLFHDKSDIVIARSTVSGYVSVRHTEFGSLFIRCLVYVLSRKAHKDHLLDMLTEVTNIMTNIKTKKGNVQLPELKSTLRKKLYLMPEFDPHLFRQ